VAGAVGAAASASDATSLGATAGGSASRCTHKTPLTSNTAASEPAPAQGTASHRGSQPGRACAGGAAWRAAARMRALIKGGARSC
jgi:hypothetical protein